MQCNALLKAVIQYVRCKILVQLAFMYGYCLLIIMLLSLPTTPRTCFDILLCSLGYWRLGACSLQPAACSLENWKSASKQLAQFSYCPPGGSLLPYYLPHCTSNISTIKLRFHICGM